MLLYSYKTNVAAFS